MHCASGRKQALVAREGRETLRATGPSTTTIRCRRRSSPPARVNSCSAGLTHVLRRVATACTKTSRSASCKGIGHALPSRHVVTGARHKVTAMRVPRPFVRMRCRGSALRVHAGWRTCGRNPALLSYCSMAAIGTNDTSCAMHVAALIAHIGADARRRRAFRDRCASRRMRTAHTPARSGGRIAIRAAIRGGREPRTTPNHSHRQIRMC